jgi:hypothetical protein
MSTIEQFKSAGRLDDATSFSTAALIVTGVICLAIGILGGFIAGYFFGGGITP